jgi:hypothetical protein
VTGVALIAHFAGDSAELANRFRAAVRGYADFPDAPQPNTALLLQNKDGIVVVLAWPEGASLQPFRTFLRGSLDDFGLPHPRVEHYRAQENTWTAITRPE